MRILFAILVCVMPIGVPNFWDERANGLQGWFDACRLRPEFLHVSTEGVDRANELQGCVPNFKLNTPNGLQDWRLRRCRHQSAGGRSVF